MTTHDLLHRELIRHARLANEAQVAASQGDYHAVVAYLVEMREHAARTEQAAAKLARESVNPTGANLTRLLAAGAEEPDKFDYDFQGAQ